MATPARPGRSLDPASVPQSTRLALSGSAPPAGEDAAAARLEAPTASVAYEEGT
jgi:hypothetical protein